MDALLDEAESLEAILMEDVSITRNPETNIPELMETTIFNDNLQITLQVLPSANYPDVSPQFKLLRPRGLDDRRLDDIKKACIEKLNESVGFPVVFDLIEVIREHMTQSNLPSGQCVVCLYGFEEGDEFKKTSCFHYLHSYCLARHLDASKKNFDEEQDKLPSWLRKTIGSYQPNCPVCRDPIEDCSESLKNSQPPAELNNAPEFKLSDELKKLQLKMASLFLIQKSKGAIIDVDAENSGTLISIQTEEEARLELERKRAASEAGLINGHYRNGLENITNEENENGENGEEKGDDDCANYSQNYAEYFKNFNNKRSSKSNTSEESNNVDTQLQANGATMSFAPNVQQSQRIADPTNNNYDRNHHYNRRHYYRGGRRHQYHKHRYDRFESSTHQNESATAESQKGQCANTSGSSR